MFYIQGGSTRESGVQDQYQKSMEGKTHLEGISINYIFQNLIILGHLVHFLMQAKAGMW